MGKFLKYLLPLLFVSYVANITMFVHTHVVNGTTIVHSHPFQSSEHSHSDGEARFLEMVTHFSATDTSVEVCDDVPEPAVTAVSEKYVPGDVALSGTVAGARGIRGPPAV